MLTIQNYIKLLNKKFTTKSGKQEWIVANIVESEKYYSIAVMPLDYQTGIYVIAKGIVYNLERLSNTPDGYKIINSKNKRKAWVSKGNLTFDNFLLELMIQTALNTN